MRRFSSRRSCFSCQYFTLQYTQMKHRITEALWGHAKGHPWRRKLWQQRGREWDQKVEWINQRRGGGAEQDPKTEGKWQLLWKEKWRGSELHVGRKGCQEVKQSIFSYWLQGKGQQRKNEPLRLQWYGAAKLQKNKSIKMAKSSNIFFQRNRKVLSYEFRKLAQAYSFFNIYVFFFTKWMPF